MSKYFLPILLTLNLIVLSLLGAVLVGKWHFRQVRAPEVIPPGVSAEVAENPSPAVPAPVPHELQKSPESPAILPPNSPSVPSLPAVLPAENTASDAPSEVIAAENSEESEPKPDLEADLEADLEESGPFSLNAASAPFLLLEKQSFDADSPILAEIPEASFKRRLPNHYRDIGVEGEQAEEIYRIQAEYHRHFHYLQRRIDRLVEERDRQIENLLTEEQKERLAEKKRK